MKKIEKISIGVYLFAIVVVLLNVTYASYLLMAVSGVISFVYLFFSLAVFNAIPFSKMFSKESYASISGNKIIFSLIVGIALTVTIFGIESKLLQYSIGPVTPKIMLIVPLVACAWILFFSGILFYNTKTDFFKNMLIRIGILMAVGISLIYFA